MHKLLALAILFPVVLTGCNRFDARTLVAADSDRQVAAGQEAQREADERAARLVQAADASGNKADPRQDIRDAALVQRSGQAQAATDDDTAVREDEPIFGH